MTTTDFPLLSEPLEKVRSARASLRWACLGNTRDGDEVGEGDFSLHPPSPVFLQRLFQSCRRRARAPPMLARMQTRTPQAQSRHAGRLRDSTKTLPTGAPSATAEEGSGRGASSCGGRHCSGSAHEGGTRGRGRAAEAAPARVPSLKQLTGRRSAANTASTASDGRATGPSRCDSVRAAVGR